MFGITQELQARIYTIGENPDDQTAGRTYRTDQDTLEVIRALMKHGAGVVELHRTRAGTPGLPDMINVAGIGHIEWNTASIVTNARVELWQAPGDGTLYIGDPDRPDTVWAIIFEPGDGGRSRFGYEAYNLVDGDIELDDKNWFTPVDVSGIEPLVKIAEWRRHHRDSGYANILVPTDVLKTHAVAYLGETALNAAARAELEAADA